jgi:hypothetical protein
MPNTPTGFHPATTNDRALAPVEEAITRGGSSDAAMLRVSVEIARQFPRDEIRVLNTLLATLDAYPQFAERALYSIPYRDRDRTVRVEGLTIRAAETMATAWGHMRVGVRILSEDDNGWDLEAIAFDMQSNYWELQPARASKWIKHRDGRMELLDDRRQIQARGAAASKLKRNCVLSVLPLHLKAAFEKRVREKMAGGDLTQAADRERTQTALAAFLDTFSVTEAMLVAYVGKPRDLWVGNDLADLRAVYNALQEQETTVAEAFGGMSTASATPAPDPAAAATVVPPTPAPVPAAPQPPAETARRGRGRPRREDAPASSAASPASTNPFTVLPPAAAPAPPVAAPGPAPVVAAPAPGPAPIPEAAIVEAEHGAALVLWHAIDECQSVDALDDLLGRMYMPGGGLMGASRALRSAALVRIAAKRDALATAQS